MTLTTTTSSGGMLTAYSSDTSIEEVIDALDTNGYNDISRIRFFHDGSNYIAVVITR